MLQKEDFPVELKEYARRICEVMPLYLTGKKEDEQALVRELGYILKGRDSLQEYINAFGDELVDYARQLDELDRSLIHMRDAILIRVPFFPVFRRVMPRSRDHWWYYLDLIESAPPPYKCHSLEKEKKWSPTFIDHAAKANEAKEQIPPTEDEKPG